MYEPSSSAVDDEGERVKARRKELGRFLRERRSRLHPDADESLPGGRRHVRGLRRDEVAARADIGLTWYTMLEQGRVENVSPRTVAALAGALRLGIAEREHLAVLAAGAFEELRVDHTPPSPELCAFIERATFGIAFVVTPSFDVVAFNADADAFFHLSDYGSTPNLLRIMLADRRMRTQFIAPDWQHVLAQMIGHFRLSSGRVGGAAFADLIDELRGYPEFAAAWDDWHIALPPAERSRIRIGDGAARDVTVMAFASFQCPTYTIIFKPPAVALDAEPAVASVVASAAPRTAADEARRRAELGAFLRRRREQMRPEDIGLRPIGRRHAKGLRRDEVAARAGIGASWYTMLEQGRVENVTERTLRSVADALLLTHRERLYLEALAVASFAEFRGYDAHPGRELLAFIERFPDGHAHFHDVDFHMLAWNAQADDLYGFGALERPNLLEVMARNPEMQTRFIAPNWEEAVQRMLAHYRFAHALHDRAEAESLPTRLARESPRFAAIAAAEWTVVNPASERGRLHYPRLGRRDVNVLLLTPAGLPTHTLVLKIDAVR